MSTISKYTLKKYCDSKQGNTQKILFAIERLEDDKTITEVGHLILSLYSLKTEKDAILSVIIDDTCPKKDIQEMIQDLSKSYKNIASITYAKTKSFSQATAKPRKASSKPKKK